jgi:hypothetical protein
VLTRRIMIREARSEAMSNTTAVKWAGAAGAGPTTSQMKAAAANASTMPPSSHCSAERQEVMVWLRIIGSTKGLAMSGRRCVAR